MRIQTLWRSDASQTAHDRRWILAEIKQRVQNHTTVLHRVKQAVMAIEDQHPPHFASVHDRAMCGNASNSFTDESTSA
ncbi:MAG: hypothetical protein ACO1TE_21170 [Prosthecobacter sp.]